MQAITEFKSSKLEAEVSAKLSQWEKEAAISACKAIQMGIKASLVQYPSGMRVMRFAEYGGQFGMVNEVRPEVWELLVKNGGKIYT